MNSALRVFVAAVVVVVVGGAAAIGYLTWNERNLPIYEMGEQPPVGGYAVNTLLHDDASYVSAEFEFCLRPTDESTWFSWGQRIGKTADGGFYVYKLNGQDGADWVFLRGLMTGDSVYRNTRLTAITLDTLNVTALAFTEDKGHAPTTRRTEDQDIIREVVTSLSKGEGARPALTSQAGPYALELFSPQLAGLSYLAYVIEDDQGAVYLAKRGYEGETPIPAGERFSQWVHAMQ